MRVREDFFDKLRAEIESGEDEARFSDSANTLKQMSALSDKIFNRDNEVAESLDSIAEKINKGEVSYLTDIDWFEVNDEILKLENLREFIKKIDNIKTRVEVLDFLMLKVDYYFREPRSNTNLKGSFYTECTNLRDNYYCRENYKISNSREDNKDKEIYALKERCREFEDEKRDLLSKIESLESENERNRDLIKVMQVNLQEALSGNSPTSTEKVTENDIFSIDKIIEYANTQEKSRAETLQLMLFSLLEEKMTAELCSKINGIRGRIEKQGNNTTIERVESLTYLENSTVKVNNQLTE